MTKKVVLAALIGWGIAFFLSPRDVAGWFKPRTA